MNRKGFTLVELVMVIVILGILAAIAIPRYVDLSTSARLAAAKGSIGSIRAALSIAYAEAAVNGSPGYPANLTGAIFAEGVVPTNPLAPSSNSVVAAYDGAGGWAYNSGTVESNDAAHTAL